jgi:hypothetical protein
MRLPDYGVEVVGPEHVRVTCSDRDYLNALYEHLQNQGFLCTAESDSFLVRGEINSVNESLNDKRRQDRGIDPSE